MEQLALKDIFARMLRHKGEGSQNVEVSADATILVVDDSRTIVHAFKTILETAGYQTLTALDGLQAVSTAKTRLPDLILMDIVMPNMNGFEATRILAHDARTSSIPVIIISGTDQATDRAWGGRVGAKGFLAKPVQKDLLLSTVGNVLMQSRRAKARQVAEQAAASVTRNV
jgi:twitching motility two-component system response regulator PilH